MDVNGVLNVLQLSSAQKMEKPALKTGSTTTVLYMYFTAHYSYSRYSYKKKLNNGHFALFMLGIPLPDIHTTINNNQHNLTLN